MFSPSTPIAYAIELTLACNNACPGCANIICSQAGTELSQWKTLFERLIPEQNGLHSPELFRITGGEPTLHPEFAEILAYLDTFGIDHTTFTNGVWEHPTDVIQAFRQCERLLGILISLHGSTPEVHAAFSGCNATAFTQICTNIQRAADAGIEVFTSTVLTRYNVERIEEIMAFSRQLGASHAVFNRFLGRPHPIEPTDIQLRHAILRIERLQTEGVPCHLGDCVPPCFVRNATDGSNSGIELGVIGPTGDVRPDNLTRYTFGNIFEQSIEEIWQSEKAQWYREQMPGQCLECVELSRCRGGARSLMVEYGLPGDPLMKAPIREAEPATLEWHPEWKPVPHFTLREEPFGFLLCRVNWSVPVSFEAKPLLDALLDGDQTLSELHQHFGDAGLELIGQLFKAGCLDLA